MSTAAPVVGRDNCVAQGGDPAKPRWVRPALLVLLLATATCWTVGLSRNGWGGNDFLCRGRAGGHPELEGVPVRILGCGQCHHCR